MRVDHEPSVIIRHCDSYDPKRIRQIVREGLLELRLKPVGRTLVKPNLVAAGPLFPHAHTRPEFAEGLLWALKDVADEAMTELVVGERCGITIPSRLAFLQSGFDDVIERTPGVRRSLFDEEQQVEIALRHPERLRDYIYVPEPVGRADFFVNMPKFKAHPWTTVTFSMKNYIGIQDDRHRLIDHDHRLNEKIADLQYVIQPQFIAIDAIIAGSGRMLTPKPFPLGLIIMGTNQVAFDAVCCHIAGVDPATVDHIRLAAERGFGPLDLARIRLSGDVTLAQAEQRAKGFEVGLIRVEKYFEGSKITAYAGPPPQTEMETQGTDYCWGGCPGALEEAIEILRLYDKQCDEKMPRMHVVFGAYEGKIDAQPGEKVIFIGDCASWQGDIGGQLVQIRSQYKERTTKDPHNISHDDIYRKMLTVGRGLHGARDAAHLRLGGCPVSVAEQVLALVGLSGVKNPYLDPSQVVSFNLKFLTYRAAGALQRLQGKGYQKSGPFDRGRATPDADSLLPTRSPL